MDIMPFYETLNCHHTRSGVGVFVDFGWSSTVMVMLGEQSTQGVIVMAILFWIMCLAAKVIGVFSSLTLVSSLDRGAGLESQLTAVVLIKQSQEQTLFFN